MSKLSFENISVSVVVPAYNEQDAIAACLESLVLQDTKRRFEVIVINNNSTDKTAEIVKAFSSKLNLRIVNEKKKGRGAARARGFDEAKGDIVFTTDADTIVPTSWIETFLKCFEDENVVAVTGTGKINDNGYYKNELFNRSMPLSMILYKLIMQHYWLSGFSFAIRKDIYIKTGGLDVNLNAFDDLDLSFRVTKFGEIKIVKHPSVVISGRRFKPHFFLGFASYCKPFLKVALLRSKSVYVNDVR